ncbi:MAG: hypothetical protein R2851_06625 [Caldilineaceae bacterium]
MLGRYGTFGYTSDWAAGHFDSRRAANTFYTAAGRGLPPGARGIEIVKRLSPDSSPQDILAAL